MYPQNITSLLFHIPVVSNLDYLNKAPQGAFLLTKYSIQGYIMDLKKHRKWNNFAEIFDMVLRVCWLILLITWILGEHKLVIQ